MTMTEQDLKVRATRVMRDEMIRNTVVQIADNEEVSVTFYFINGDKAIFYPSEIVNSDERDDPVEVVCDYCAYRDICKYEDKMRSAVSVIGTKLKDVDAPHSCKITCECFRKLIV